jgi:phosphatidylethanolamine/phosphatidyl-N-methylethanolamine N-methyltransferase
MEQTSPRDYSFIAPIYDQVFHRPLAEGHEKLGELLSTMKRGSRILEVGVGSGLTMQHLPAGVEFTGIDVNEPMLEQAHRKAKGMKGRKIRLESMDACDLRFAAGSFDLVLAPSVLSAMDTPMEGLEEIIRVTKKGGQVAVIANLREKGSRKSDLVRRFDPLTRKYLGFRLDLSLEDFLAYRNLRLVEKTKVNSLLGFPLSSYLLFEKV